MKCGLSELSCQIQHCHLVSTWRRCLLHQYFGLYRSSYPCKIHIQTAGHFSLFLWCVKVTGGWLGCVSPQGPGLLTGTFYDSRWYCGFTFYELPDTWHAPRDCDFLWRQRVPTPYFVSSENQIIDFMRCPGALAHIPNTRGGYWIWKYSSDLHIIWLTVGSYVYFDVAGLEVMMPSVFNSNFLTALEHKQTKLYIEWAVLNMLSLLID